MGTGGTDSMAPDSTDPETQPGTQGGTVTTLLKRHPSRTPPTVAFTDSRNRGGFTLIELVVVMGMLVMVLFTAYQILSNCIDTERRIEQTTVPEKAGSAIIALMRRDLAGAFHRGLGEQLANQIFFGIDHDFEDEIRFVTTADPTPQEDLFGWGELGEQKTITAVYYQLQTNQGRHLFKGNPVETFTLYRKEVTDFSTGNVLEAPGLNQVIYDKVKSLDIKYYDGWEWLDEWSSDLIIESHTNALLAEAESQQRAQQTIGRVSDPGDETSLAEEVPPSPLPIAVRIELVIYGGVGNRIFEGKRQGFPDTRSFVNTVQLLAAQRLPIVTEDEALALESSGILGEEGDLSDEGAGSSGGHSGASAAAGGGRFPGTRPSASGVGGRGGRGGRQPGAAPGGGRGGAPRSGRLPSGGPAPRGLPSGARVPVPGGAVGPRSGR